MKTASVTADVKGMVSPFVTTASVDVHDARIELSDAKRRNLQPLTAPGDVVLVQGGKPLNRAQDDRLRALLAQRRKNDDDAAAAGAGAKPGAKAGDASGVAPVLPPTVRPGQFRNTEQNSACIGNQPRFHVRQQIS